MGSVGDGIETSCEVQRAEANQGLQRFLGLLFLTLVTKPCPAEGRTGNSSESKSRLIAKDGEIGKAVIFIEDN